MVFLLFSPAAAQEASWDVSPLQEELVGEEALPYTFENGTLTLTGYVDASTIAWEEAPIYGREAVMAITALEGSSLGKDCSGLFAGLSSLRSADLSQVNAVRVYDASRMFSQDSLLTSIRTFTGWRASRPSFWTAAS